MSLRNPVLSTAFILLTLTSALGQNTTVSQSASAADLCTIVVTSTYRSERIAASLLLLRNHAGTKEARLAQAYLDNYDGRTDDAVKTYRDILAQNPISCLPYICSPKASEVKNVSTCMSKCCGEIRRGKTMLP